MKPATLFHGGPAGLEVGDLIRPAVSLGIQHARTAHQPHYNAHRVYVTQRREYAEVFAQINEGPVYEVAPIGRLLVDLDARGSFHCSAAQIVAVHQRISVPIPNPTRPAWKGDTPWITGRS